MRKNLSLEFYQRCPRWSEDTHIDICQRDVAGGVRTLWKLLVDVMSKSFSGGDQNAQTMQMIQTMTRSKVQNMPTPDLEQTAAQSPGAVMPTSSRQQRNRQVQCCRSRDCELEKEKESMKRLQGEAAEETVPHVLEVRE